MLKAAPIGVVTPLYNGARWIKETALSVCAQLAPGDRYIVVDDGSTDGGAQIVEGMHPSLEVVRQPNAGEAAAVNLGVALAGCDVIGIVNADDPVLPGLLEAMRVAFTDAACDGAYVDWRMIDEEGETICERLTPTFSYRTLLAAHLCIPGPGAFFRVSRARGMPIRDPAAYGVTDFDFWLRYALHNRNIVRVPRVLATWRAHRDGATFALPGAALAQTHVDIVERLLSRADLPAEISALAAQARSAAHYNAALVGLRGRGVPAARHALASYAARLVWPTDIPRAQRRSLVRLLYAAGQPLSGAIHGAIDALLPPAYARQAVLDQSFGDPRYAARQRHHTDL